VAIEAHDPTSMKKIPVMGSASFGTEAAGVPMTLIKDSV
jgi:hypothetical protein